MVEQCFSAKEKGKGKAKEPEPSTATDEQIAHLFQWLCKAIVLEDIGADVLNNPIEQLALSQVLNKLDIDALGKGKCVASPPQLPEAKKAHTKPSVFVEGSSTQRALPMPYNDDVPAVNDQRMDKHPDFRVPLPVAGPLTPSAAKARLPKPAVAKAGPSRSATAKAGTMKLAINPVVADDPVVIAIPIGFPVNMLWGLEAEMIEVLKLRTYIIPSTLSQEPVSITHWDPCDKEFFVTQMQAAQAATGAPVASDSGSNKDDHVSTSKQHILDSNSDDNTNEHCHKKQYNANARQLLVISAEIAKLPCIGGHFQVLLQLHESRGHSPLGTAKWLCYGESGIFTHLLHQSAEVVRAALAQAEEPSSVDSSMSAALTEEGPSLSVALATTNLAMSSSVSSQNAPAEESMELDYTNNFSAPTNPQIATTPQIDPSPSDAVVATNIATTTALEAGSSGSIDMANAVLEHGIDIMTQRWMNGPGELLLEFTSNIEE
ncbi:hypothetical protein J132_09585 [Termitomyces sp. J132]|nr:hypothetical protein J132_09585 [Termitomyces sp. J132]